jgi:hypothetical protein
MLSNKVQDQVPLLVAAMPSVFVSLSAPPPQIDHHLAIVSGVGAVVGSRWQKCHRITPHLLLRVGNRFALPPLTRPTKTEEQRCHAIREKFVTVCDKRAAIFSNFWKHPLFGVMTGESVFKRFRRFFWG